MLVPGKNLVENNKKSDNKKIFVYAGAGLGVIALLVGIFLLFKFVLFAPDVDEEISESDIDKILSTIKKEEDTTTSVYGGLAENNEVKKSLEKDIKPKIDEDMVVKNKENNAAVKPSTDNSQKSTEKVREEKIEIKKEPVNNNQLAKAKAKTESKPKPVEPVQKTGNFKFTVQIASFKQTASAEPDIKNLKKRGFETELITVDLGAKGTWYRLRVGKFMTKEEAKSELWKLNSIGYKNAVVAEY